MTANEIITSLFVFALAGFLGLEIIRKVPKLLHTPLMALTNALSAISLVGSAGDPRREPDDLLDDPRVRGRGRLDDQRRRRLPDHRQDAADVPPGAATRRPCGEEVKP